MKKILFAVLAIVFPVIVMAQCPVPTTVYASVTFTRISSNSYWYRGSDNSWGATAMTVSTDGLYEYFQSSNNANQFKIATSTDSWDYNYTYVQAGFNSTDVTYIGDYGENNCYCWQSGTYYILVYYPNTEINATNNPIICASTTLPDANTVHGVFTIDGSGHTVKFSRGNLQYQASTNTWQFAAHQYDFIGADNENIAENYSGWIDLFGWATNGNSGNGTHYQPYDNTSTADTYGNSIAPEGGETLTSASDWGSKIGSDWRTLTNAEWDYIVDTRASGATVEGNSDARFVLITIRTDDNSVRGMLLFPDGYDQGTPSGVTWSASDINAHGISITASCTVAGWEALEAAGCVFLPCAGQRDGTTISNTGTQGYYWTVTSNTGTKSHALSVMGWNTTPTYDRHIGNSVHLVQVQ